MSPRLPALRLCAALCGCALAACGGAAIQFASTAASASHTASSADSQYCIFKPGFCARHAGMAIGSYTFTRIAACGHTSAHLLH